MASYHLWVGLDSGYWWMRKRILCMMISELVMLAVLACGTTSAQSVTQPVAQPPAQPSIDLVVVIKSERIMYLYADNLMIKSFPVSLGKQPLGRKRRSGDQRTPEGAYILDWRNPDSLYHLSIHISYPNAHDRAWAQAHGVHAGSNIMIHGQPDYDNKKRSGDWTNGCIAVSNQAMDYLWQRVREGTPIHILP